LITEELLRELPELLDFKIGMMNVFILHTSASLTINENADPTVIPIPAQASKSCSDT
jgi:thiamine phosphate synthase YjbQ (UPF0047 family)